jgi:hypothetical protein
MKPTNQLSLLAWECRGIGRVSSRSLRVPWGSPIAHSELSGPHRLHKRVNSESSTVTYFKKVVLETAIGVSFFSKANFKKLAPFW